MRIIRAVLALFFAALIVIGIGKYFEQTTTIGTQDSLQSVWHSIASSPIVEGTKQFFSPEKPQIVAQPTQQKKTDIAVLLAKKAEQTLKNNAVIEEVEPLVEAEEDVLDPVVPVVEDNAALDDLLPVNADVAQEEELIEEEKNEEEKPEETEAIVLHLDYSTGVLSSDNITALTNVGVQEGNVDGEILWIHYCDFDVSYCGQGIEENIAEAYSKTYVGLSYIFKPFPPTSKSEDILPHRAALCLADMGTSEQFARFYEALYAQPEARVSIERMIGLARSFGIADLGACIDSKQYDFVIQQEKTLAKRLFALRALPANVFINKNSGKYILVPGYYTYDEIVPAIQWAVNNY